MSPRAERLSLIFAGSLLLVFLVLPMVALFATTSIAEFAHGLRHPLVWPALRLSLLTTAISLAIVLVLGTPLAWTLAGARTKLSQAVEIAMQLPLVVPPAVAGVAMLLAFGSRGLVTSLVAPPGWTVAFSTTAVVLAEVFVSAPFFVQAAVSAFRRIDPKLLLVARTFGATPVRVLTHVALPLAAPGLVAGAAMSWARSLGEFGATLMFAGNLQGTTQTLPLAIYTALESDVRAAQALSIVLVSVAFALLMLARAALARTEDRRAR